mgnify:CR=1 FL=1
MTQSTMSDFAVSQIFAGVAFVAGFASVQFKSRRAILLALIVSTAFNGIHFLFLDRPGPGALMFLTGTRYIAAIVTTDSRARLFFLAVTATAFAYSFESWMSTVALCGTLVGTYGSFEPTDRRVRLFFMAGNICWLIHNSLVWTPVGIIMEITFLISSIIGYWRHYGSPFDYSSMDGLSTGGEQLD